MKRGRPFQPGNQFGRGRPKGSPNKKTQAAQQLFEQHSPTIMALAINRCREDRQMLRMFASNLVPKRRGGTVNLGGLALDTLEDLNRASAAVLKKAISGKIAREEALEICSMIETRRRVLETQDVDRRLRTVMENLPAPRESGDAEPGRDEQSAG
jgi:hypothetical protein